MPRALDRAHHPTLTIAGALTLMRLRLHACAPRLGNYSGSRLHADELSTLRAEAGNWLSQALTERWPDAQRSRWIEDVLQRVPHYAGYPRSVPFDALPTCARADLSADPWRFVPRDQARERIICFTTSGTTGEPLKLPSLPIVAARYWSLHRRALQLFGIDLRAGTGQTGIVLAGYQQQCFSYASVNPLQRECGVVKLNLHPDAWRTPDHRRAYLDALAPELVSGDPVSLPVLAGLGLRHRPRAVLSTSMAMSEGLRRELESALSAPVLDLYSMNELGPIAVYHPTVDAHVLLQPAQHIEILDAHGRALAAGEPGEIVVTGGINPLLPLLRYRTGDRARLVGTPLGLALADLQGRAPVRFSAASGWLNNVEITQALRALPLRRFALHQYADGALRLALDAEAQHWPAAELRLRRLFGADARLHVGALDAKDKISQYTSDFPGATDAEVTPYR